MDNEEQARAVERSAADVRKNLAEVVNDVSAQGRIVFITHHGRRVAAVVPLSVAERAETEGS